MAALFSLLRMVSGFQEQWRGDLCLYRKMKGALYCGSLDTLPVLAGFPLPAERRKFKKALEDCGNMWENKAQRGTAC